MNGVSGYDPPHYMALKYGLRLREPEMLAAIASLGPYEVSIERASDEDGQWKRYVAAAPGAALVAEDEMRTVFRVPAIAGPDLALGAALPIDAVRSSRGDPTPVADHRIDTVWGDGPQHAGQWLLADLGRIQRVGGVSLAIANHPLG